MPKIRGYVAEHKDVVVLLYRKNYRITYLVTLNYKDKKETIKIGSRFYGRIYPNSCDISPDGKYFLYFAMGHSQKNYDKKLYCWTAICTPPKLTAELLFEHNDTWGGGGRFIDDKQILIEPGMYPGFDTSEKRTFDKYDISFKDNVGYSPWPSSGHGWALIEEQIDPRYGGKYPIPKTWIKTIKGFSLIKTYEYESYYKVRNGNRLGAYDIHTYSLLNEKTNEKYSLDQHEICQWADFDNYGRLILSRGSNVFIYQDLKSVRDNKFDRNYNLEKLITLPNTANK